MSLDASDDFAAVADGLVTVTLQRRGSGQSASVRGLRRRLGLGEAAPSDGATAAESLAWHLAAELDAPPRPGDRILDADGRRFTVLEVHSETLAGRWRCVCRNLAVAEGLDQYVDIQQAEYAKGAGGAVEPAWHVWRSGVPARIQPVAVRIGQEQERSAAATRFTIYLDADLELDATHRLRAADGTLYAVAGYRKPQRIDALLEVDAEKIT